ncbi:uncharacterized protein HMPREF1541_08712 [Cyphellophora europaea CBS 101466]|uniref:Uncharacterized protein n=1 Tax=Cyphellophora europaea (strain CBS 101466) TaxID=1220924 RepID=W2RL37_CYPE1|nr:uncharacterized protein HMPREF1541_08712 [Cyphellophora europaea CBS 101466]ETN36434.1 hypothetical protein HMPREF1541_08712 [Cyphellophora europaea CBS 101466]
MLGMREELLEREEVERQMRELEMQERMQVEAEEMERRMEREADGDMAGVEERDLDDEVPEAEEGHEWGSEIDGADGDDMQGDLDDEIPDADEAEGSETFSDEEMTGEIAPQDSPQRNEWSYDSRREPDTDEESGDEALQRIRALARQTREQRQAGYQRRPGAPGSDYGVDERDSQALALTEEMLDEDEMGDVSYGGEDERDLDGSVPDAEEGEWEHTDTDGDELDEEDMDISIMPAQARTRRSDGPQQLLSSAGRSVRSTRVVSGNAAIGSHHYQREGSRVSSSIASSTGISAHGRLRPQGLVPGQSNLQGHYETPTGVQGHGRGLPRTSMLLATESSAGATTDVRTGADDSNRQDPSQGQARRGWLNPASARRNLFGLSRGAGGGRVANINNPPAEGSGGLFTPEAPGGRLLAHSHPQHNDFETPEQADPQLGSGRQTRSGRLLAGFGRRARRDGEEGG